MGGGGGGGRSYSLWTRSDISVAPMPSSAVRSVLQEALGVISSHCLNISRLHRFGFECLALIESSTWFSSPSSMPRLYHCDSTIGMIARSLRVGLGLMEGSDSAILSKCTNLHTTVQALHIY